MSVLVVEDGRGGRGSVCEMLRAAGVAAAATTNCAEAIHLLAVGKWDVVVSDLVFHDMLSGLDLANAAQPLGIRCVIMSRETTCREQVNQKGATFLARPFDRHALLRAIAA